MSVIAETLCQQCGARAEALMALGGRSVAPCPCGGMRQVVRVMRRRDDEPAGTPELVERSVRHRSDEETSSARPPDLP